MVEGPSALVPLMDLEFLRSNVDARAGPLGISGLSIHYALRFCQAVFVFP